MNIDQVLIAGIAATPPTLMALAAYQKARHTNAKIGKANAEENQRVNGRAKRSDDRTSGGELTLNTVVAMVHADVINALDETREARREIGDVRRELSGLRGDFEKHIADPKPRRER